MKVRFWGTRGSLPVSLTAHDVRVKLVEAIGLAAKAIEQGQSLMARDQVEAFVDGLDFALAGTFGGHSSCVEIMADGAGHVLCDLGTGVRPYGAQMLRDAGGTPQTYHVFMSHPHWDHIMGFPFFTPAYIPGNRIIIHGCHDELEAAFRRQHAAPSFPVDFSALAASIEFRLLSPNQVYEIAGFNVTAQKQLHEGDSYGWRFERAGKSVVYSTDSEHKLGEADTIARAVAFFRDADLVIFDAMYSLADAISVKADWGHSSNIMGVRLCREAGVGTLCLFHHEPVHGDARLAAILAETERFELATRDGTQLGEEVQPLRVLAAWDGLVLTV
ncbi:MAG: hypothetical protein RIR70_1565 [Pseudomonadota bacterium]